MKALLRLSISLFFLFSVSLAFGDVVSMTEAENTAENFYSQQPQYIDGKSGVALIATRSSGSAPLMYIFNLDQSGFVIISAWDGTIPVLGFSLSGTFPLDDENRPPAFDDMLEAFTKQIKSAVNTDLVATPEIEAMWEDPGMLPKLSGGTRSVNPLLTTTWNQSCYYNELCPEDADAPYGYCGRVPAGCVALAMAQVMKYWDYPVTGTGSHSYYVSPYGTQSADFGSTTYPWDNMPNSLGSSNMAVATLIYHCAVSVNMQFGPDGSGAYTSDAATSLKNYFNYDPLTQFYNKNSFSDAVWESMLRDELDLGRPVIYRGQGTGGHAWVCDGYSADNYFHMNWGWGGYANGYFYLSNLNPAGNNFTYYQGAIMHILPAEAIVEPPQNLEASVSGTNVQLTWEQPLEPQWIHWDNGSTSGVLSIAVGGSFDAAARWTPGDLEAFDALYITKVSLYLGSDAPDYVLKLWTGENAASLVYSQPLANITTNAWNTIDLNNPVPIDASGDLYIGVSVFDQPNGESALGRDSGPAVEGRGDMISFDGTNWAELNDFGINFNWNIQAFVNTSPDGKSLASEKQISKPTAHPGSGTLISVPVKPGAQNLHPDNRGLMGYNIYRDEVKINEAVVPAISYTDQDVTPGTYEYFVTSVYNAGESAPSNTVTATSGFANQNLQLNEGWNSISSLLVPVDPNLENIFGPIMDEMVFMQNMTTFYDPGLNINTIGEWDYRDGYLVKVNQNCTLTFGGLTNTNRTITLNNGWNLIPVLSDCEVNTEDLFAGIITNVRIVKDAAGCGVYWPEKGINTLPVLEPGKSYFVKIFSSKTITFPACN